MTDRTGTIPLKLRIYRALGPILGGIALDLADFATFGPVGLAVGWLFGGVVAAWIAGFYRLDRMTYWLFVLIGAVYCMAPFTDLIPAATTFFAVCRFFDQSSVGHPTADNPVPTDSQVGEETPASERPTQGPSQ